MVLLENHPFTTTIQLTHLDVEHQWPLITRRSKTRYCIFLIKEHTPPVALPREWNLSLIWPLDPGATLQQIRRAEEHAELER